MTQVVKQYIELADLKGVRVECRNCAASMVAPLVGVDLNIPHSCPNCHSEWASAYLNKSGTGDLLKTLLAVLNNLKRSMSTEKSTPDGFTVLVEVSGLDSVPSSIDRRS